MWFRKKKWFGTLDIEKHTLYLNVPCIPGMYCRDFTVYDIIYYILIHFIWVNSFTILNSLQSEKTYPGADCYNGHGSVTREYTTAEQRNVVKKTKQNSINSKTLLSEITFSHKLTPPHTLKHTQNRKRTQPITSNNKKERKPKEKRQNNNNNSPVP